MLTITVAVKDQYGSAVVVPVCDKAKTFAAIAGTKTLTLATLCKIEDLGYTINAIDPFGRTGAMTQNRSR